MSTIPRDGDGLPPTTPPLGAVEAAGTRIGPYKLLQLIGEGGMGAVWMAEQQQPVRRQVALKVIKAGMDSAQVVARFEAERQALALMDHPNIAKVLDGGTTEAGRPYFVMDLVRGVPITQYCDEMRLPPRERLELFVQVCQALAHAHQKGITHRDIKPSNVLVAPYDGRPVVKVIDFGVAKAAGQQLTERTMFTEFGAVIGTLEYMSPEQSELNNHDIDTRSDIYSMGVLLYELLTGTPPFKREQLQQAAFSEVLRLIREVDPPKPSARLSESKQTLPTLAALRRTEPAKLPKLLRGELDCVVMKALEKDRNRRYETASALARDIQHYLCDEPVEAQPPTVRYRMKKFVRRHKGPTIAAALVALAILAGMAGTTWGLVQANHALAREADQRILAEQERDEKEQARAAAIREAQEKEQARAAAEREKDEKEQARLAADVQRRAAEAARKEAESALHFVYFNSLKLAQQYWAADNLPQSRRVLDACPAEVRGWEWRYLDRLHHGDLLSLPGNGQFTTSLKFSQDGQRLAAFSNNGDAGVRVWDLATKQPLAHIRTFQEPRVFRAGAMTSDGQTIALAEDGNTVTPQKEGSPVTLWEAGTGKFIRELASPPRPITSLSFSPDGKWLAAARADRRNGEAILPFMNPPRNEDLVVWDVACGEEVFHPKGYGFDVLFSPVGSRLLTFKLNTAVRLTHSLPETFVALFDTANWTEVAAAELGAADAASFSGDGRWLALAGWDRQRSVNFVRLINPATGKELSSFDPGKRVGDFELSRDGAMLAVVEANGSPSIDVWDVKARHKVRTLRGHTGWMNSVAFASDGRLASCSWDKSIKLWDPTGGDSTARPARPIFGRADKTAFSPGGERFAFSQPNLVNLFTGASRTITVLDLVQKSGEHELPGHAGGTLALAFSRDATRLASGGAHGDVKVWDLNRWTELCTYGGHDGRIEAIAMSPDGVVVASIHQPPELTAFMRGHLGDNAGRGPLPEQPVEIHVWDSTTGAVRHKLPGPPFVTRLAISPDGKTLVSATSRVVQFWDVETGAPLRELDQQQVRGAQHGLLISTSGKLLVTAADDTVQIWDAATGRVIATIEARGSRVLSPDETRLATATGREIKLWDALTGQEIVTLPLADISPIGSSAIIALAWTSDGHRLRAGLADGSVIDLSDE